jgi:hypothetical protein
VDFLRCKRVERVRLEFGFVLNRDLEGKPQALGPAISLINDFERNGNVKPTSVR